METKGQEPPQTAEQAKKQTESEYIKLMDKMEASASEYGDFFVTVGQKSKDTSVPDNRALILIAGRKNALADNKYDYAAITKEGEKIITTDKEMNSLESADIIGRLTEVSGDADEKFIDEAMANSIKKAKDIKTTIETEQKKQARAKKLLDSLDQFSKPIAPAPAPETNPSDAGVSKMATPDATGMGSAAILENQKASIVDTAATVLSANQVVEASKDRAWIDANNLMTPLSPGIRAAGLSGHGATGEPGSTFRAPGT